MIGMKAFAFFAFCFVLGTFLSGIMEGQASIAVTRLTANISANATSMTVASTQDFIDTDVIYVESEEVRYASKDDTHFLGVTRGIGDTEAVAHSTGAKVKNEGANVINSLLGYNIAATSATYGSVTAVVGLGWNLIKAIPRMIAWNYSYLEGKWVAIKYFICWPISAGFVFSLGMMFITAIQGIFRPM